MNKDGTLNLYDMLEVFAIGIGIVTVAYLLFSGHTMCINPIKVLP